MIIFDLTLKQKCPNIIKNLNTFMKCVRNIK